MSAANRYDAAIVGGGHNGLTCAAYLAQAGLRVVVLEAGRQAGGAAATHEFAPGYRVSSVAHLLYALHPRIVRDLDLVRFGLSFRARDLPTRLWPDAGPTIDVHRDRIEDPAGRLTPADRERWAPTLARLTRLASALGRYLTATPPRPEFSANDRQTKIALAMFALALRRLGRKDMLELTRIVGMNANDLANDFFDSAPLKGLIALDSTLGVALGPRSPNTVIGLLFRLAALDSHGQGGLHLPAGGMGRVTAALEAAARAAGAEIRLAAPVARILVRDDRASGVVLESGEEIAARIVVSSADPQRTLLGLLGPEHLDTVFVRRIRGLRMNGAAAKVHLALDGLPEAWRDLPGRMVVAPDSDYVERAYDSVKYGAVSERPALEIVIPSLSDPSLAPPGGHVASILAQYAPYKLRGSTPDEARARLRANVLAVLAERAPDLAARLRAVEVLTPHDLESRFLMTGGQWHHGEITLDHLFMLRPVGGYQQYRMPVSGLWLCGAGAHPGGHVSGLPGANAAREILKRRREWEAAA
jgi:phytoene dehydrogenase-like protein